MDKSDATISELERILKQVNAELRRILLGLQDSGIKAELQKIERLSRWTRGYFESSAQGLQYAIAKAKRKAQEYDEPFVVAINESTIALIPKARFLKDKPFGLGLKDVVFDTDETGKKV